MRQDFAVSMLTRVQILTPAQFLLPGLHAFNRFAAGNGENARNNLMRLIRSKRAARVLKRREPNLSFRVQSPIDLRSAPDRMDHFVSRLSIFKLRPKQHGLSVELLGGSRIGLRWESFASFELLCGDPARFRAQRKNLLGYVNHFFRALHFVGHSFNSALNFVRYSSEVFTRLPETSVAFAYFGLSSAPIEQIIGQLRSESSKVAGEERDVVLITVPGNRRDVGIVIRLCQANGRRSFLHFGAFRDNLRVRCQSRSDAFLAMARLLHFGDGGIEFEFRGYRQS